MPLRLAPALLAAVLAVTLPAGAQTPAPPAKTVITNEAQLPRFAYPLAQAPSALLVADDATFAPFAAAVGRDVDAVLTQDDIRDPGVRRDYLETKLALALLAHDAAGARAAVAAIRAGDAKPDQKLLDGRITLAVLDAQAGTGSATVADAFRAADAAAVAALPWDVVGATLKGTFGFEQATTRDAVIGGAIHDFDPIWKKSGTLDGVSARALVATRAFLLDEVPYLPADVAVLRAYIAAHDVVKPGIWAARDVTLRAAQVVAPVAIGIWDNGVDPHVYARWMAVDRSGRNGLAFNDDGSPSTSDLYTLPPAVAKRYPLLVTYLTGENDLFIGADTPDARSFIALQRSLTPQAAAALGREFDELEKFTHGSHVAGIAVRGNPGARIVVARFDDNLADLPFAPSVAYARRMATNFEAIAAYFRAHHVRVANLSWGDEVSEFEEWIAKRTSIADPQARKALAQRMYAIWRTGMQRAIAATPGTLFVIAAGNQNNSASFIGDVPSSFTNPNVLVVGAVDQAGDPTGFTSYGPTVAVYANGLHVASRLPGGYVASFSGTSMAAPAVTNLAGKLWALDPALSTLQVKALILDGATTSADGKRRLIDPKRSVALLRARYGKK